MDSVDSHELDYLAHYLETEPVGRKSDTIKIDFGVVLYPSLAKGKLILPESKHGNGYHKRAKHAHQTRALLAEATSNNTLDMTCSTWNSFEVRGTAMLVKNAIEAR